MTEQIEVNNLILGNVVEREINLYNEPYNLVIQRKPTYDTVELNFYKNHKKQSDSQNYDTKMEWIATLSDSIWKFRDGHNNKDEFFQMYKRNKGKIDRYKRKLLLYDENKPSYNSELRKKAYIYTKKAVRRALLSFIELLTKTLKRI